VHQVGRGQGRLFQAHKIYRTIIAILFLAVLKLNHGTFTYSLDDPYIHLALSDQSRHGHYGISAGHRAAPSSSILFPFLLALASGALIHPYLPLLIGVARLRHGAQPLAASFSLNSSPPYGELARFFSPPRAWTWLSKGSDPGGEK